jgi:hypothetical protein
MFCLPFNLGGVAHFGVNFNDSALGATSYVIGLTTGTDLYNNRDFSRSDNLLNDLVTILNAVEALHFGAANAGLWSVSELVTGTVVGRIALVRAASNAADDLSDIEFVSPSDLGPQSMGFSANTVAPSSETVGVEAIWFSDYVTGRQWIPHPVYPGSFLAHHEAMPSDFIVGTDPTSTAATSLTQDYYGGHTLRRIHIMTVNAASMLDQFASDADYLEAGQSVSDPNITWDAFRRAWRDAAGTQKTCRFHPDMDTAANYHEVLPLLPWIASVAEGSSVAFEAPYRFDLDIEVLDA